MLDKAFKQAGFAWMSGAANPSIGAHLANLYYLVGDKASARLLLKDAKKHIQSWDMRNKRAARELEDHFDHAAGTDHTTSARSP